MAGAPSGTNWRRKQHSTPRCANREEMGRAKTKSKEQKILVRVPLGCVRSSANGGFRKRDSGDNLRLAEKEPKKCAIWRAQFRVFLRHEKFLSGRGVETLAGGKMPSPGVLLLLILSKRARCRLRRGTGILGGVSVAVTPFWGSRALP